MASRGGEVTVEITNPDPNTTSIILGGEFAGTGAVANEKNMVSAAESILSGRLNIHLENVSFIDSLGIGIIFKIFNKTRDKNIEFHLMNPTEFVKKTLMLAKVDRVVKITSSNK